MKKKLITIVGPTGIGKSNLAIRLAQVFNGEIISADSRQIYRHMDIGTAKPRKEELNIIPHHLINIVEPDVDFSLAQYHILASSVINEITKRKRLPFLVGGSGLYVWSLLEGWNIPRVPPDKKLRNELECRADETGGEDLYNELMRINPDAANRIDKRNIRRVIRALEISKSPDMASYTNKKKNETEYDPLIIGLTAERSILYGLIDKRVDRMIKDGLVAEVKGLLRKGYKSDIPAFSGIGYRHIVKYIKGELNLETAIQQIKYETHRFVRHQYSWFKPNDGRIRWFDIIKNKESEIKDLVKEFIAK